MHLPTFPDFQQGGFKSNAECLNFFTEPLLNAFTLHVTSPIKPCIYYNYKFTIVSDDSKLVSSCRELLINN